MRVLRSHRLVLHQFLGRDFGQVHQDKGHTASPVTHFSDLLLQGVLEFLAAFSEEVAVLIVATEGVGSDDDSIKHVEQDCAKLPLANEGLMSAGIEIADLGPWFSGKIRLQRRTVSGQLGIVFSVNGRSRFFRWVL